MRYVILALALLVAIPAHADSVITVTATDVALGFATLDASFNFDVTTQQLVPGSASIDFRGSNLGSQFTNFLSANGGELMDFTDAQGDFLQFDPADIGGLGGTDLFPALGSYITAMIDVQCATGLDECATTAGMGFTNGMSGTLVVTDPPSVPEPASLGLLALGLLGLALRKAS
jgi:PEP-CTERM motif-containing protein